MPSRLMCQPQEKMRRASELGKIQHCLGRTRRVLLHAPGRQHGEYAITARDGLADHGSIIRRSGNEGDSLLELVELGDAALPTYTDHLVTAVERVLHHVLAELSRCTDDANLFHGVPPVAAAGSARIDASS
ncbi:MAG: hypothetical protein R3F08_03895 [Dokdonella sp.]